MLPDFLSSSGPMWKENNFSFSASPLSANLTTDVCIIGAGIAGLTCAYQLLNLGKNVIILDRNSTSSGETANTTAHLSNALDDYYFQIEKSHGVKFSGLAAQSHSAAIDYIEEIIKENNIECDFIRLDGYLFSKNSSLLHDELLAAHRAGLYAVKKVETNLFKAPCLVFPHQAQFHPLRYLYSLAKIVAMKGGNLFGSTHVTKLEESAYQIKVATRNNFTVTAKQVITATNAPFQGNLKIHSKIIPHRSYAIGVLIIKGSIKPALYWDTEEPYHYVRLQPYNIQFDMLIIGGEDHRVGFAPKSDPYLRLEKWAKNYFPMLQEIKYRWSGQVLEPVDYLAYIGQHPKFKNVYITTGDSGHGMTHGTIAGLLISDLINRHPNPWTDLYKPSRFSWKNWQITMRHNLTIFYSYFRYLFLSSFKTKKNLRKGEGAIIQCGMKKRAVYKDESGNIHECAAVCPHLRSLLHWNPIEKTWDCAAHGSRFDTNGKILNGPANKQLKCFSKNTS